MYAPFSGAKQSNRNPKMTVEAMTPEAMQIIFTPDKIAIALAVVLIAVLAYLGSILSRIAAGVEKLASQGGFSAPAPVAAVTSAATTANNNEIALAIAAAVKRSKE